jgi:diguanylate cyclase (GGDEF)-like protein
VHLDVVVVAQDDKLSAVLSEFARTLGTNFPIQYILDHLVERIVDVLPITAAGVTLISDGMAPRYVAASDESVLRFEQLQIEIGQGPCLVAFESGDTVIVPDLNTDGRFPLFAPAAVAAGLRAVFTFPLRHGDGRLGALDLYRDAPGELDADDMAAAQTLADVAAAYLLNAQARDEARATSDYFRHTALHDVLTGLPNRLLLKQRVEHAAQRARRSHTNAAVLFVDLDRFKHVNDAHGHQVGDDLLLAVSGRLSGLVRPGDTLARFSGDEFVFLCEDLYDAADAESLAARIDESFTNPFVLNGIELAVTASVGVAFAGPGQDITEQLLVDADIAMYQAKRKGGAGHEVFDLRESLRTADRVSMERDLRNAFNDNGLDVAYQPIVRCADGHITGVEALLRWTHPDRGRVPPLSMVAVAEQSGLISAIGTWVLERSCKDRARWLDEHPDAELDLAVNVSARQLMAPNFSTDVATVLAETRMDPAALILEMTENIFIEDSERALGVLTDLKGQGIRLALDDFGTGYSSLSYLLRLPIDIVKIDKGFIAGIGHAPAGAAIVAAVTNLAHGLGLAVTAEGVETQSQRDAIIAMECEFSQGFFYARPMSAAAISEQLGGPGPDPMHLPVPIGSASSLRARSSRSSQGLRSSA